MWTKFIKNIFETALIAFFCLSCTSVSIYADEPIFSRDYFIEPNASNHYYLSPNEHNYHSARAILSQAPKGAYVSVGTERGLLNAGMVDNVTHIFLIDAAPNVVWFNRYNIALLKLSRDREDYIQLRSKSPLSELRSRAEESDALDEEEKLALKEEAQFMEWRSTMMRRDHQLLNRQIRTGLFHSYLPFGNKNYINDDEIFSKLKELADQNKIEAHNINFKTEDNIVRFINGLRQHKISLSVLDVSNAWWMMYTEVSVFQKLVLQFSTIARDDSLLFMSDLPFIKGAVGFKITHAFLWNYSALTFRLAKSIHESSALTWLYRIFLWLRKGGINGVPPRLYSSCKKALAPFSIKN